MTDPTPPSQSHTNTSAAERTAGGKLQHGQPARWDDQTRLGVQTALNESQVLGIRLEPGGSWCDLLAHVPALPQAGPIDLDARRILRLTLPTQIEILLRKEHMASGIGPAIALGDMDAVEQFFASLSWSGTMYGWKFLDDPSLTSNWPAQTSLTIDIGSPPGSHSLYWFNECGRDEGGNEHRLLHRRVHYLR